MNKMDMEEDLGYPTIFRICNEHLRLNPSKHVWLQVLSKATKVKQDEQDRIGTQGPSLFTDGISFSPKHNSQNIQILGTFLSMCVVPFRSRDHHGLGRGDV